MRRVDVASGRTVWVSEGASVLGLGRDAWTEHDLWRAALHPEDADRTVVELRRALREGRPLSIAYRLIDAGGKVLEAEEQISGAVAPHGEPFVAGEAGREAIGAILLSDVGNLAPRRPEQISTVSGADSLMRLRSQPRLTNLRSLLRSAVADAMRAAQRMTDPVTLNFADGVPETVEVDPDLMSRAATLLVMASVATGPSRRVCLEVGHGPEGLALSLEDQPADQVEELPSPSNEASWEGTARRIRTYGELVALVERLEGSMTSDRTRNGRRMRQVILPCPAADFASGQIRSAEGGLRLLYAEDDMTSAQVMASILRLQGHSCEIVLNGQDAVEIANSDEFDMILLDLRMPVLDGIAAARKIREIELADGRPPVPIVAISGHDSAETRGACLAVGIDGFLQKPVRIEQLRAVIAQLGAHTALSEREAGGRPGPISADRQPGEDA